MKKFVKQRLTQMNKTKKNVEKKGIFYEPIKENIRVDVYVPSTCQWVLGFADTIQIHDDEKSYVLRAATSGKYFVRNRRYIVPATPPHLVEKEIPLDEPLRE